MKKWLFEWEQDQAVQVSHASKFQQLYDQLTSLCKLGKNTQALAVTKSEYRKTISESGQNRILGQNSAYLWTHDWYRVKYSLRKIRNAWSKGNQYPRLNSIQVAVGCCPGLESGVQLQDIPPLSKGFWGLNLNYNTEIWRHSQKWMTFNELEVHELLT